MSEVAKQTTAQIMTNIGEKLNAEPLSFSQQASVESAVLETLTKLTTPPPIQRAALNSNPNGFFLRKRRL